MATFEEQLTALEAVVERLERGELSLDDSVRLFEEGVRLSGACKKQLEEAEGRIQMLVEQGSGEAKVVTLEVEQSETRELMDDEEEQE
jgi:exodeoxyribonuclease VII small subunit